MVVVTAMAASSTIEGAGSGSVNAKRSSRYDAAREAQSEWRDAENIPAKRQKWSRGDAPYAIPRRVLVS